jgi:multidrug resistance efflux pump
MKMFNTVRAQFSGTVDRVIMTGADGTVVQKGQPLFKITPDEKFVAVDPKQIERERRARTSEQLGAVLMTPHEKLYDLEPREVEVDATRAGDYVLAV